MDIQKIVSESRASQNKEELTFLLSKLNEIKPKVILEIGSWRGYSAEVWQKAFEPEWMLALESDRNVADPELIDQIPFMFRDSHLQDTLQAVKEHLGDKQVDFLFIDGDHTYEGVKRDFELYSPLVREGGIIALHDIALNEPKWVEAGVEVCKLWGEICYESAYRWDEIKGEQGTGTGILYVV